MFDPYRDWLGVLDERRPPTLYQLLGLSAGESNPSVIEAAVTRQLTRLQRHIAGPHSKDASRLQDEIQLARTTLLDPARRAAYEAVFGPKTKVSSQPATSAPLAVGEQWLANPATPPVQPAAAPTIARPAAPPKPAVVRTPAVEAPVPVQHRPPPPPEPSVTPESTQRTGSASRSAVPADNPFPDTEQAAADEFPSATLIAPRPARRGGPSFMLMGGGILALGLAGGIVWFVANNKKGPDEPSQKIAEKNDKEPAPIEPERETKKAPEKRTDNTKKKPDKKKEPPPKNDPPPPLDIAEEFKQPRTFRGHQTPLRAIAVSPDGKQLLTTADDLSVFSWTPEKERPSRRMTLKSEPGVAVAFLPGAKQAVAVDGGFIFVLDLATNQVLKEIVTQGGGFQGLAAAPDGKHILTCSNDGRLRWWDITKEMPERTLEVSDKPVDCVALAADGRTAFAGSRDGTLSIWDLITWKLRKKWAGHKGAVATVSISPDRLRAVSGGEDKVARVWDLESGTMLFTLPHAAPIASAAFSVGSSTIFTASETTVRSWDAMTGDPLRWSLKADMKVLSLALDPKDRYLVAGFADGAMQLTFLPAVRPDSPLPSAQAKAPKQLLPVPLPSAIEPAVKAIREKYKDDYAQTATDDQLALSDKLLAQARFAQLEPAARFAHFQEAREIAGKLGQANDSFKVIAGQGKWFEGDDLADKASALKLAGQRTTGKALAEIALAVVEDAERRVRPDIVDELFRQRELFPQSADTPELNAKIQAADKRWMAAAADQEAIAGLVDELRKDSGNSAANGAYGKYLCFRIGEWADGLPRLAKGDDPALKVLAASDLVSPKEAATQAELGKMWFNYAAKADELHKGSVLLRSKYWCDKSIAGGLPAQDRLPVGQRITEIGKQLSALTAATPSRPGDAVVRQRFNTIRSYLAVKTQWNIAGSDGFTPEGVLLKSDASMTSRFRILDGCRVEFTFIPDRREIKLQMNGSETVFKPESTAAMTLVMERKGNDIKYALLSLTGTIVEEKSATLAKPEAGKVELKIPGASAKNGLLMKSIVVNGPIKPAE